MIRIRQNYWSYIQLARLDKPIGIWLVLFPALWSLIWVSPDYHTFFQYVGWMCLGAVFARSVGCIINDGWDRNLDSHVQRTAQRPLAVGTISKLEFILLFLLFGGLALGVLAQFNLPTVLWGLAVIPLIILYPLMKRWTYWPQAFLAITFNWGALIASTALLGHVSMGSFLIYLACACWTMAYDTIYAHQDADDDLRIGIRSTALRFGKDTKLYVAGFMSLFFGLLLFVFIQKAYGAFVGGALFGIWGWSFQSLLGWVPDDPVSSRQVFLHQNTVGWVITSVLSLVEILPLLWP
jgi:4-hydroxybenzoate polyprenyltransferase